MQPADQHKKTSFLRNEDGATAVEFGLIAVLFLAMLGGVVEMGRMMWTYTSLQYAIEEAARSRIVDDTMDATAIEDAIEANLGQFMDTTPLNINVSITTAGSGMQFLEIEGTYSFIILIPIVPADTRTIDLTASTRMPLES